MSILKCNRLENTSTSSGGLDVDSSGKVRVTTLADSSGNNDSTPAEIASGRAKAWVNFNGSGTVAIRDSYNVSSITDSSTGVYVVTMTNALANTNYAIIGNSMHLSGSYLALSTIRDRDQSTRSTTQFQIDCLNSAGSVTDGQEIHVAVFGD